MPVYNKLIRDLVPAALERKGIAHRVRTLDEEEYAARLLDKLAEEAAELEAADTDAARREELADVFEVASALADLLGGRDVIDEIRLQKAAERGAFVRRLLLIDTAD